MKHIKLSTIVTLVILTTLSFGSTNSYTISSGNLSLTPSSGMATTAFANQRGDVNLDGSVNASDAVLLLQYLTTNTTLTSEQLICADVNLDAVVDAADASCLLYYVVNGVWLSSSFGSGQISVILPTYSGNIGSVVSLPITVDNLTGKDVRALSFTLLYDKNTISIQSVQATSTLLNGCFFSVKADTLNGKLIFTAASASSITGSGVLLNLLVKLKTTGATSLTTSSFKINSGLPLASVTSGIITANKGPIYETEPNNTISLANLFEYTDTVNAAISPVNDIDYYKFSGVAGDTVMVYAEKRGTTNSIEGIIKLLDQNGAFLYESYSFTGSYQKQRVVYVLPATGIYYVRYSFRNNTSGMPPSNIAKYEQEMKEKEVKRENVDIGPELGTYDEGEYRLILNTFKKAVPLPIAVYTADLNYSSTRFNGVLVQNGLPVKATIEYGPTINYGTSLVYDVNSNQYEDISFVTEPITGLLANTTYHYRLKVENSKGSAYTIDKTFITPFVPEGWAFVNSGTSNTLNAVKFYDTNIGFAAGENIILKTTNAGLTWEKKKESGVYKSLEILDANTIIAVGDNNTISKTTDGGGTWVNLNIGRCYGNMAVSFKDMNNGIMVSDCPLVYKTTDGGSTWTEINVDNLTSASLYTVKYFSNNTIIAAGYNRYVLRSTDSGATWTVQQLNGTIYRLKSLSFKDDNNGIMIGDNGVAFKTSDGGISWTSLNSGHTNYQNCIDYLDDGTALSVGSNGLVFKSGDNGSTWAKLLSGTSNNLNGITAAGSNSTFVTVGNWGTILKSTDYLKVVSPNGGEKYKKGSIRDIVWSTSSTDKVKIELSTNNGSAWSNIATDINANLGKYTWTVPNSISDQCLVRVTDQTNSSLTDVSDAVFSIINPGPIAEVEPNNTLATAMNVAFGDTVNASVNTVGDIDYYKINGVKGDTLVVYSENRNSSQLTGDLRLIDQSGNQMGSNENFTGVSNRQRIFYILPYTGSYSVRYSYWGNLSGMPKPDSDQQKDVNGFFPQSGPQLGTNDQGDYSISFTYFKKAAPMIGQTWVSDLNYSNCRYGGGIASNGLSTTVTVEYGATTSYGNTLVIGSGISNYWDYGVNGPKVPVTKGSTYHFRIKAENSLGTVYSGDNSFTAWVEAPEGWTSVTAPTSDYLNSVKFYDSNIGYAVGNQVIIKTTDGGNTWNLIRTKANTYQSLEVISANTVISVGNGLISKTIDGGATWNDVTNITGCGIQSISFFDANNGVLVTNCGSMYKTINGGDNWSQVSLSGVPQLPLNTVKYFSNNTIIAAGGNRYIYRSTDGGTTWTSQQLTGSGYAFWGISFKDNNTGIIVGNSGIAFRTTDQGATWISLTTGHTLDQRGISYLSNGVAFSSGAGGFVYKSLDNGTTWTALKTGTANFLYAINQIGNSSTMMAAGDWGALLKSQEYIKIAAPNGGENWVVGSTQQIKWSTSSTGNIKIDYTTDNGTIWTNVTSSTAASIGTNSWVVPNTPSSNCRVRLTDLTNSSLISISAGTFNITSPPNINDYVLQTRGDTLVVKDYADMGNKPNSLANLMAIDTSNVPAGRVYMLKKNGNYPMTATLNTNAKRATVIVGDLKTPLVQIKDGTQNLPILSGYALEGYNTTGGITAKNDLTIKNCKVLPANSNANVGWAFFSPGAANLKMVFDNLLMEHTKWVFVNGSNAGTKYTYRNSYFVNMNGYPCRRNSGVYDGFSKQDTILVENCTHINGQGSIWKLREYAHNRVIFNHNTFINCSGYIFMNIGYQSNMSIISNIFINCNLQPYSGITNIDPGEKDLDNLPMGLVNVRDLPVGDPNYPQVDRKIYIDRNVIYWDPQFADMVNTLNTNQVNHVTTWKDQMITMNTRSQAMFNNNTSYPYLIEGTWYKKLPAFKVPQNLFTTQIAALKAFTLVTVDTVAGNSAMLPDWRVVNTGSNNFMNPDWPIPVDLSYTDVDLQTEGLNGFPVGDLNWFPSQKTSWLAQRSKEYSNLENPIISPPPIIKNTLITITDKDRTGSATIEFGTSPIATDGIDETLDEALLPPVPPAGIFDARFILPNGTDASLKDYRLDPQDSTKWRIIIQPGSSGYPMTFTWDKTTLPADGSFTLNDEVTGTIVNVDMRTTNTYTLTNTGIKSLVIKYSKTLKVNVTLAKDWNIISVPLKASNMNTSILFPCFTSQTYAYENGYVIKTLLENGKGYWIKYCKDTTIVISGDKVNLTTVPVKAGWNLIGPYDWEVLVSGITTTPSGILCSNFYEYNKGYILPSVLKPGKGYWIKACSDGVLNLPAASPSPSGVIAKVVGEGNSEIATEEVVKEGISIRVSDALGNTGEVRMVKETGPMSKYDLPPVPPRGIFETRWSSDRRVEKSGEGIKEIVISSAEYPVTLMVTGGDIRVKDNVGGVIINQIVKKGGSITITNKAVERLSIEELQIPTEFRLCQNYPNPFNPETKIEYWIPEAGKVTMKIYDVLGREVETLIDQIKEAGKYEIRWNAAKYSSGVYFYNISTGNNHSVKKMLLIK